MTTFKTDLNKAIEYFDNKSRGRNKYWKPTKETSRIRILPSWNGGLFFREVAFHFGVGFDKRTVLCPRRTPGILLPCPICEHLDSKYRGVNSEEAREMFSTAGSKIQYLYNIIDLDNPDEGVQIYCSGRKVWNQLMTYMKDVNNWGDFTDVDQGFNITITKEGKDRYSSYDVKLDRLPSALKNKDILKDLKDLDKEVLAQRLSYDEIKNLLTGSPSEPGIQNQASPFKFEARTPEQYMRDDGVTTPTQTIEETILNMMDDTDSVVADEQAISSDRLREQLRSTLK